MSKPPSSQKIDLARLNAAMTAKGIKGPTALAKAMGLGHASTTKSWLDGNTVPGGDNLARLTSVLGVSVPYLFGAKFDEVEVRTAVAKALRENLGHSMDCPEADIIEAMGALTFDQRKTVRQWLLAGLIPGAQTVTPLPPRSPAPPPGKATDSTEHVAKPPRRHRHHR